MDVDALVRQVYPPTIAQSLLALLAQNVGEVVNPEQMAVAVFGDTPAVWSYANSQAWHAAAKQHIHKIRRRLCRMSAEVDIETVPQQGYRLVQRKAPKRGPRAEMQKRRETVQRRYDALIAEQPDLKVEAAWRVIAPKLRHTLPLNTFKNWVARRRGLQQNVV